MDTGDSTANRDRPQYATNRSVETQIIRESWVCKTLIAAVGGAPLPARKILQLIGRLSENGWPASARNRPEPVLVLRPKESFHLSASNSKIKPSILLLP
jgi:hypothetical protein